MKLWLDDNRVPPIDYIWVKTAPEAIQYLMSGLVEEASLDHDLGLLDCGTGYDVVLFLEQCPQFWPDHVAVHSRNPVASKRMRTVIDKRRNDFISACREVVKHHGKA